MLKVEHGGVRSCQSCLRAECVIAHVHACLHVEGVGLSRTESRQDGVGSKQRPLVEDLGSPLYQQRLPGEHV